jgi:hypothetical protein
MRTLWISLISLSVVVAVGMPPAVGAVPDAPGRPTAGPTALALPTKPPEPPNMPPLPAGGALAVDPARAPGAFLTVSPRVVHPGDTVTMTFGGGPDIRWSMVSAGGALSGPGCSNSMRGIGRKTCTASVAPADLVGTLPAWLTFQVGFDWLPTCGPNGCISSSERIFVALLPAKSSLLTGSVRDREDHMLRGVMVTISGMGRRYAIATNGAGEFSALLPQGTWTVTPSGTWDPQSRVIKLGANGARADFRSPVSEVSFAISGSRLVNGVDWTTVPASGLNWRTGTLHARTASGAGLANRAVEIDAPYFDGSAPGQVPAPRISICDATTWRPLFATTDRVDRITDANGDVGFTIMFGSEPSTSLLHSRLKDEVTALDVERLGQVGAIVGPSLPDITTPMQNAVKLGLPAVPLFALSPGSLQSILVEWWLGYRAGDQVGPDRMSPAGDFVPVRTRDNMRGAIVFYPAGNPRPLREHLASGAPLPGDYATFTLGFRQVPITPTGKLMQWQAVLNDLPSLATWEATNGPATDGFLLTGAGLGTAGWLGGPIPPVVVDRTGRAAYARCVPGASPPTIVVEVHSPVRLDLNEGRPGFALPGSRTRPVTYVLTDEAQDLALTGTGSGPTSVVVRSDDAVRTFTFTSRAGASGKLSLTAAGKPRLVFAGKPVRAVEGVALRIAGAPKSLRVGRTSRLSVRVTDAFGAPVPRASLVARGAGVKASGLTDDEGVLRLVVSPKTRGTVTVTVSAPGARPLRVRVVAR